MTRLSSPLLLSLQAKSLIYSDYTLHLLRRKLSSSASSRPGDPGPELNTVAPRTVVVQPPMQLCRRRMTQYTDVPGQRHPAAATRMASAVLHARMALERSQHSSWHAALLPHSAASLAPQVVLRPMPIRALPTVVLGKPLAQQQQQWPRKRHDEVPTKSRLSRCHSAGSRELAGC